MIGQLLCWLRFHKWTLEETEWPHNMAGNVAGRHECQRLDCAAVRPRIEWPDPPAHSWDPPPPPPQPSGYQPEVGLDRENPPQGGSGVPAPANGGPPSAYKFVMDSIQVATPDIEWGDDEIVVKPSLTMKDFLAFMNHHGDDGCQDMPIKALRLR